MLSNTHPISTTKYYQRGPSYHPNVHSKVFLTTKPKEPSSLSYTTHGLDRVDKVGIGISSLELPVSAVISPFPPPLEVAPPLPITLCVKFANKSNAFKGRGFL